MSESKLRAFLSGGLPRLLLGCVLTSALALGTGSCSSSTSGARTCTEVECGRYGSCFELDAGAMCVCDEGYTGDDCAECASGYEKDGSRCVASEGQTGMMSCEDDPCGGNGTCDDSEGEVVCDCDEGYTGDDCSECDDGYHADPDNDAVCLVDAACGGDSCPANASCDDTGGIVTCTCDEGWDGDDCAQCAAGYHDVGGDCVEDTECGANTCPNGTCDDSSGVPVCTCNPGYAGEHCDECAAGYHADGDACVADETCDADSCPTNATCDDTGGVVTCECDEGYTADESGACVAAGEDCPVGLEPDQDGACTLDCPEDTTLVDIAGVNPATLPIPEGYELVPPGTILFPDGGTLSVEYGGSLVCIPLGYTCDQYDPCAGSAGGRCEDQSGLPVCICDTGYVGLLCSDCLPGYHPDGAECVPDETCQPTSCSNRGECDDSLGEIDCTCNAGTGGTNCQSCATGFHEAEDGSCVPDDVCEATTCSGHGQCSIVDGEALCSCFAGYLPPDCAACAAGYHLEGTTCVRDQTCTPTTCSGNGTCTETDGEVDCDPCDPGYDGANCGDCADGYTRADNLCVLIPNLNVCTAGTCNGRGTCNDASGTALCDCVSPYTGGRCTSCREGYVKHSDGTCQLSTCGDGITDVRTGEECDWAAGGGTADVDCPYGSTSCDVCGGPAPAPPVEVRTLPSGAALTSGIVTDPSNPRDPSNHCRVVPGIAHYCGDGSTDAGHEGCDDGPLPDGCTIDANGNQTGCEAANSDACLVTCEANTCGDGYVNPAAEQCDDGNNVASYGDVGGCAPGCTLAGYCGDSLPNGSEQCDDGNTNELDACRNSCATNVCGDGVVRYPNGTDIGSNCDEGTANTAYCYLDLTRTLASESLAFIAAIPGCEVCLPDTCGAGAGCTLEYGVAQYCGDGIVNGDEECDFNDINRGMALCALEESPSQGFITSAQFPATCCNSACVVENAGTTTCGDGYCGAGERTSEVAGCLLDCQCGNGVCEDGEDYACPSDCDIACCDGVCDLAETNVQSPAYCPYDCHCGDGICGLDEAGAPVGEGYCESDCCGDGQCTGFESPETCEADCDPCGDNFCDVEGNENAETCAEDCFCGNGSCDIFESCEVCLPDCGACGPF